MTKAEQLVEKIKDAEYVLIGIGEEFNENFTQIGLHENLMKLLHIIDENDSLNWAVPFMEKAYIEEQKVNENLQAYQKLYELIKDKNYFIVTTCIDGAIEKAGFDEGKIVQPCGGYHFLQCSEKCSTELIKADNYVEIIKEQLEKEGTAQRPMCPKCGKPLVFNNVLSEHYVEEGYLPQWEKYTKWLSATLNRKLCILELGVGMDFPSVIRFPFEKVAFFNQKASFYRVNETLYQLNEELADKGVSIHKNAQKFLLEI